MSADDLNGPEMTGPELEGDERLAAEYAMGLLEGEELLAARGRMANEPAFAGLVSRWEQHLMPLLDDVADAAPSPEVWDRIASELAEAAEKDSPVATIAVAAINLFITTSPLDVFTKVSLPVAPF